LGHLEIFAAFSFFGNKTITTGEGGMVVAKSSELLARAYHLKTQAVSPVQEYWHDAVGYNYRMTNICAAIGLAQLENATAVLEKSDRLRHGIDWACKVCRCRSWKKRLIP